MEHRQRGKKTYTRDMVISIFEKDYLEQLLGGMGKEIKRKMKSTVLIDFNVYMYPKWGAIGPVGELTITNHDKIFFLLRTSLYRDGWKTNIHKLDSKIKLPENYIWTQETEKIIPMTVELMKEILSADI